MAKGRTHAAVGAALGTGPVENDVTSNFQKLGPG